MEQDESSDDYYVYLVREGTYSVQTYSVQVDRNLVLEPCDSLNPQDIFGELVLYDDKRGSTITVSVDKATLFRIEGQSFKDTLLDRLDSNIGSS